MTVRGRLGLAALLAAGVAASGLAFERAPERAATEPRDSRRTTGMWVCPHGGGEGWRAWVSVANPGTEEVAIRTTTYGADGVLAAERSAIPARAVRMLDVPAPTMAGGTLVEAFGGVVAVGTGVARPANAGTAAEPCVEHAGRTWYVPGGTSERGRGTWLVAVNPFATDAAFEVTLAGESRALQPGPLRGVVLPAGRAVAFDLNRFALGERALASTVRVSLGRVAVSAVGVDTAGVRSAVGVPRLARTWYLPGGPEDLPGSLGLLSGRRETPFRVRAQGLGAQEILTDVSVGPLRAGSFDVSAGGGLVAVSEGRATFAAARRVARAGVPDEAAGTGIATPATRWIALPAGPAEAGAGRLVLQNPGTEAASATITLLGTSGEVEARTADLGPGQTEEVDLSSLGPAAVAALVEADRGALVVGRSVLWSGGFALAGGIPVRGI